MCDVHSCPSVSEGDQDVRYLQPDPLVPDRAPRSLAEVGAGNDPSCFGDLVHRQRCKGSDLRMPGTVNIARDLWDDPTFKNEEMSQREAWIWLIANASWKPRTTRVGDHVVDLQRGQLAASTRFLADAWMWSEARVRRYLAKLEDRRMICRDIGAGVTVVTLCKYNIYQSRPRGGDAEATQPPTHQRRTVDANQKKGERREEDSDASASNAEPINLTKAVFDEGVRVLVSCGLQEAVARRFVGKLRKDHPGQDDQILEAIRNCSRSGAEDPIPWITARLKPKPSPRPYDLSTFGSQLQ